MSIDTLLVIFGLLFYGAIGLGCWKLWKRLKPFIFKSVEIVKVEVSIDKKALDKMAWKLASDEIQGNMMDQALWAQAFATASGDSGKQKVEYLKTRQKEIFQSLVREARDGAPRQ